MKSSWWMGSLSALLFVSSVASAGPKWGYKELKESEEILMGLYLTEVSAKTEEEIATAKNNIEAYSVKKGATGSSASVSLTYRAATEKKTISKFCHEHEPGEVDCH